MQGKIVLGGAKIEGKWRPVLTIIFDLGNGEEREINFTGDALFDSAEKVEIMCHIINDALTAKSSYGQVFRGGKKL